jgi:hypothetical protein
VEGRITRDQMPELIPDLWVCPKCGRPLANRNRPHSCGSFSLEQHPSGNAPEAVRLFEAYTAVVREFGPVLLVATRSRIGYQVRTIFSTVTLRSTCAGRIGC